MQYNSLLTTLRQNFKEKGLNSLHASAAVWFGGVLALATGFWIYNPSQNVEILPETGTEAGVTLTVCPDGIAPPAGCQYFGGDGIQQAVDAAKNGDTVLVKSGNYTRQSYSEYLNSINKKRKAMVVIKDKNITLTGEGRSSTKLDGDASVNMSGIAAIGTSQVQLAKISIAGFKIDGGCGNEDAESFCSYGDGINAYSNTKVNIINSTIDNNSYGIFVKQSAQVDISSSMVKNNSGLGIYFSDSSRITITNTIVSNNGDSGIYVRDSVQATITNNTIVGNRNAGIYAYSGGTENPAVKAINNIIVDTKKKTDSTYGYGIGGTGIHDPGKLDNDVFKHNLVSGNEADNTSCDNREICANIDQGRISADPKFVSATDYLLQTGSPAINAGDPSILDPDGSRSDIGAYGGPGACGLDPSLCVTAPKDLVAVCNDGAAKLEWTRDPAVTKFILRINHEPRNAQGGINTNQCKNAAGATVGWHCNSATAGTQCLSANGCDDRYIIVTASGTSTKVTHEVTLLPGQQYSWSLANQVNGVERAFAGSLDTNLFTCGGAIATPPPTLPPTTECKPMDVNNDGVFNITDLASFAQGYPNRTCSTPGTTTEPACGWEDINGDTLINIGDFASFAQRYYTHHDSCAL